MATGLLNLRITEMQMMLSMNLMAKNYVVKGLLLNMLGVCPEVKKAGAIVIGAQGFHPAVEVEETSMDHQQEQNFA